MNTVAVVILNWNGQRLLEKFLPSITRNLPPYASLYVADNGSKDDSVSFLSEHYPQVQQLFLEENWGFAEGYNKALSLIEADYYILLNSDIEVSDNWIDPLYQYMETHPQTAACQPKLLAFDHPTSFEYAGGSGGYIDSLGYPFCRGRIFDTVEQDQGQYDNIEKIFWATGAALMIRSEVYDQVGGLDGTFFAHMEEIDLCWRIQSAGYDIVCVPQSSVYHVGGGSLPKSNPHKTYLNFRNNLIMIYKNSSPIRGGCIIFIRFLLDWLAALVFILQGKSKDSLAILKAQRVFLLKISSYRKVRKNVLTQRTKKNLSEIYIGSILLTFYIGGKKKFSEIRLKKTRSLVQ